MAHGWCIHGQGEEERGRGRVVVEGWCYRRRRLRKYYLLGGTPSLPGGGLLFSLGGMYCIIVYISTMYIIHVLFELSKYLSVYCVPRGLNGGISMVGCSHKGPDWGLDSRLVSWSLPLSIFVYFYYLILNFTIKGIKGPSNE